MDTILRAEADEVNKSLINFIKFNFKGKKIAIHIYEDGTEETGSTDDSNTSEKVKQEKTCTSYTLSDIASFLTEPDKAE